MKATIQGARFKVHRWLTYLHTDLCSASSNIDKLVKSRFFNFSVIPADPGSWSGAGAGIQ